MSCYMCPGLDDSDFLVVEEVKSSCFGLFAGISACVDDPSRLNLQYIRETLYELNQKLTGVLDNNGGVDRLRDLREAK